MKLEINITKKHLYYALGFVVFVFIVGIAMAQTAVNNPGHPAEQIDEGTIAGTLTISGGNVGIGTASPGTSLHVLSPLGTNPTLRLENSGGHDLDISTIDSTGFIEYYSTGNNADQMFYITKATAKTEIIRLDGATGNVGIGTTSPAKNLHISGGAATGIRIEDSGWQNWDIVATHSSTAGRLDILRSDGATNVMSIVEVSGGGNVGIGTTTPSDKLVVNGEVAVSRALKTMAENQNLDFKTGSGFPTRMTITTDGNVGIGTTSPVNKLQIYDGTDITPSGSAVGQLGIKGSGYSGYIAMNAAAMYLGHNSALRDLIFQTDETDRMTITRDGGVAINNLAGSGSAYACVNAVGQLYRSATACS